MTIEELGARAGITTRTIRSYQTMGMLAAPRKVGRVGYYAEHHLERLRGIGRLMDRGFSLAAIAALFEAYERGLSLAQVLGVTPDPESAGASRARAGTAARPPAEPAAMRDLARAAGAGERSSVIDLR